MDNITEDIIKLVVALVMGAIIGAEREYKTKAAGFRTVTLIMVGSTLFTMISLIMGKGSEKRDAVRLCYDLRNRLSVHIGKAHLAAVEEIGGGYDPFPADAG